MVATMANAQSESGLDFCIGPKIGYQATKLSLNKEQIKSDFKGNMTYGLFGRVTINRFIIQPELMYMKSNKLVELEGLKDVFNVSVNQGNFAVPVYLGYQFVSSKMFKMRANVGPIFYFAVGDTEYETKLFNMEETVKISKSPNKDMSLGAAFNLGLDVWRFTLDVNYSLGITNIFDDKIKIAGYEIDVVDVAKQNVFTVTLGFKFL